MTDDFHIILPSNTKAKDNRANQFTINLDKHLDLTNGKWRVGLTDISFYKNNVTITKGSGFELTYDGGGCTERRRPYFEEYGWVTAIISTFSIKSICH